MEGGGGGEFKPLLRHSCIPKRCLVMTLTGVEGTDTKRSQSFVE
jgi:hypothetical protein